MTTPFLKYFKHLQWEKLFRLFVHPFTLLVSTPIRLLQTLWACRVLADGQWEGYHGFTARAGINSLFYWTAAVNISRYGRKGISPQIGLGNFSLAKWYFYSLPSLFTYWRMAPVVPLMGMFGWLLSHAVWSHVVNIWWVLAVMTLALASVTFYANMFEYQNYNVLGWLFLPLGLYGLLTQNWLLAALAWLGASFGSVTVVFVGGIFSLVTAAFLLSILPLVALIPAGVKLVLQIVPLLLVGTWKDGIIYVARGAGMVRTVKYKRKIRFKIFEAYFLALYLQFMIAHFFITGAWSPLFGFALLFALLNLTSIMRFADHQSIQMMMMSLATALTIQSQQWLLLPFYWLLMSPLPKRAWLHASYKILDVVPACSPYSVRPLLDAMEAFLQPVQAGQRVWMAFDDPCGAYEKVFDGYRALLELPLYVAALKGVHFMPDWWAVFETNYEGAPSFWGRSLDAALQNIQTWKPDYIVIYQQAGSPLEPAWEQAGFLVAGNFSWADHAGELRGEKVYSGPAPDWWLLRLPVDLIPLTVASAQSEHD